MTPFIDLGIDKKIVQALAENSITQPTEIQQKAVPILLKGEQDFIGLAQTGTGKTAAFGLPLLQHIDVKRQFIQALVLSPTRELGQQIAKQMLLFSKYLPHVAVQAVYGGIPLGPQIRALKRSPQVLVATPGRLIDLVERRAVDLTRVTRLVLDEADEMLNMGFKPAIDQILSFLPRERSIWLFSATMPQEINLLVHRYMAKDHVTVKLSPNNVVNENIEHQYMVCSADAKQNALQVLLDTDKSKQSIIFCRTKAAAQRIAQSLMRTGVHADSLHGDLSQNKRDKVMRDFKNHGIQALVATDVAARGIDVKDLHYVVHYNLPEQFEYYTHRSGRTARAGKKGISLCLVTQQEVKTVRQISRTLGIQFKQVEGPSKEGVARQRLTDWAKKIAKAPATRIDSSLLQMAEEEFSKFSKEELIAKLVTNL
ncbi:MAG: DEAD/DEAH box helicase [Amoebophilaceae bacterium]|nr:DEAD/DEAH box helicase [Amoebophilaceae bacterium]